jgi:N-acetylmuramoyl-L-alanine amidase
VDSLDAVDPSALAGKRIVLDPGHGGFFRGSLGVHGLTEAEVNLAVALELEPLLTRQGAQVLLTRRDNRDFLSPADSALRADLTERARIANAFGPDLFVSIHHNADPNGAHDRNETQTYYKLGDEGASLDAAASIHRYLKRNLGIQGQRLVPGNYFVLRNSDAPAVLTEASYLTNPDVESRLALAEKRRLEAEALYLGIAHFFGRRAPAISSFDALGPEGQPDTAFAEVDGPTLSARVERSYDRAQIDLDGRALEPLRRGNRIEWRPDRPLPAGRHEARLRVSLAGVGSARERRVAFRLARRPALLRAALVPGRPAALVAARIEVLDRAGLPSLDPVRLKVTSSRPGVAPAETVITARDGVAWSYLRLSRAARAPGGPLARVTAAAIAGPTGGARLAFSDRGGHRDPPWTGWAEVLPERTPLRDAPGTAEPDPAVSWINRDGFVSLEPDSDATGPTLPGFRLWGPDTLPPRFTAIAGGALRGRRILLDPDGGGEESGGMGPSGTRAALYNMDVAQALASMLRAAGAEVALSRHGDQAVSDVERVRVSEAHRADRFLRIGHRAEPPRIGYYFSSAAGQAWGRRSAAWLARLGLPAPSVSEDAQYPLQQTSSTALYVSIRRVDDPTAEESMVAAGAARSEAYALYLGLIEEWSGPAAWPLDSLEVQDAEGRPAAGARVTLGGAIVLQADAQGRVRFVRTEGGPLAIAVEHPKVRARGLLLDSQRGILLTGPPGR